MPALDQWEKRLAPYFSRRLRMIGEIPISRREMEDMAAGVRGCIQRNGLPRASEILDSQYPYTFLVFLTAFGAYNTQVDYWGALGEEIGSAREHLFNHHWHQRYLDKIKKLGLRHFAGVDPARPYVTTIRFHGGIPVYSLPDFFRHFVMTSVERPELAEVSTRQVLDVLLRTAYNVDSPVINFLENSGSLGEEFFDACRNLARHYKQHQEILSASASDLPERVVQAFEDFVQEEYGQTEGERKIRLRKPALLFTPYFEQAHLYVRLPEQDIPLRYAEGKLEWHIQLPDNQVLKHPCSIKMQRQHMVVEADFLPINFRPRCVQASLIYSDPQESAEKRLGRWLLPLMPTSDAAPLVAFRADGVALRPGDPLPGEELLLVYPTDMQLQVEGAAQPSHTFGRLFGAWEGWQAHGWDLSQAWSVQLVRDHQPIGEPIPVAGKLPEPELVGQPTRFNDDPSDTPLFVGEIPKLRIPLRPDVPLRRELSRWRVEISSSWNARPELHEVLQLNRFEDKIAERDGWAELPLEFVFGSEPAGTFVICLSSPMDDDIEFRFRLWPKMTVLGIKKELLPNSGGSDPHTFSLLLPDGARCEKQAGTEGIELQDTGVYGWTITASPETVRADLNLLLDKENGDTIRVPVFIPIPRLRWALALGMDQSQLQWKTRLIQLPLEVLTQALQNDTGALHIAMPGLDTVYRLALELVEVDGSETVRQEIEFQSTPFEQYWLRAPLTKMRDTLTHAGSLVRLDLKYQATRTEEELHIPLVLLSRRLEVTEVDLRPVGELKWLLVWKETFPVKNRRVLIQPAWQPWQEAWEYRISDKNTGSLLISDVGLPSARYHLHFFAAPTDDPPAKWIPSDVKPIIVDLCTPEDRLAKLEEQIQEATSRGTHEMIFRAVLEAACIYEDLGNSQLRDEKLSELAISFVHIDNLRLFLGLLRWLDGHNIQSPYSSFFRKSMFKPELVRKILQRYRTDDPELRTYLAYVTQVKDIYAESALLIARISDNPAVLSTCLRRLLMQEERGLLPLIIEMILAARLSNQDAVDLLQQKPAWAMNVLLGLPASATRNQLLADLLASSNDTVSTFPEDEKYQLMLDALPYSTEQAQRMKLMKELIKGGREEAFRALMQAIKRLGLSEREIEELLSINPKLAIKVLSTGPKTDAHQSWLERLTRRFPSAAGMVAPGSQLKTPAGIAVVKSIETIDGKSVKLVHLNDPNIRIYLQVGEGLYYEQIILEPASQMLIFVNKTTVITCGRCNFVHPNRRVIDQHHRDCHPYQSLTMGSAPAKIRIDFGEIEIL